MPGGVPSTHADLRRLFVNDLHPMPSLPDRRRLPGGPATGNAAAPDHAQVPGLRRLALCLVVEPVIDPGRRGQ
jgi:hypothetical protein